MPKIKKTHDFLKEFLRFLVLGITRLIVPDFNLTTYASTYVYEHILEI